MRPYWHVDLKWAFGLACLFCIVAASLLYSLLKLTEEEPATSVFTAFTADLLENQLSPEEYAEIQRLARENPNRKFAVSGVTFPIKGSEIAGLSRAEATELAVSRVAKVLYNDGTEAAEIFFPSDDEGAGVDLGPFALLSADVHDTLKPFVIAFAVLAGAMAVPTAFFSRSFGRIGSPGVVLAVAGAPFAVFWFVVRSAAAGAKGEADGIGPNLAAALLPPAEDMSVRFLILFLVGAALAAVAVAGHLVVWARGRQHKSPLKPAATP
ncbi:MAG: hypothetical protein ACE5KW_04200 [Dehalococcoidia bacterium]